MKMPLRLDSNFARIEFWAFTAVSALVLFFFLYNGFTEINPSYKSEFIETGYPFRFYRNFIVPQFFRDLILFATLVIINFNVIPRIARRQGVVVNIIFILAGFVLLAIGFGLTAYFLQEYTYHNFDHAAAQALIFHSIDYSFIVFCVVGVYTIIKYISIYLLNVSEILEAKYPFIRREAIVITFIWLLVLLFLISENAPGFGIAAWITAIPSAVLLYLAGFYTLIPSSLTKKNPFLSYAFKNALILLIVLMAWGLILKLVVGGVLGGDKAPLAALWIFNSVLQMFITIPVTWWLYKRFQKSNEQLNLLQTELGQSNASIDFLRSQINPHFLFNALNTIYGTALQEGATKSSEAVQKLGDMMRFMLQENMQDKISLDREIDYLENYISLQKLRTDAHSNIVIETSIERPARALQIAPMLLIPFIENAFKHGISFRERSHIKIDLRLRDNKIHFDVFNVKHIKSENDPEKKNNGIGLQNVKQRLNLVYPGKHKINLHETGNEFFAHLTIEVAKFV